MSSTNRISSNTLKSRVRISVLAVLLALILLSILLVTILFIRILYSWNYGIDESEEKSEIDYRIWVKNRSLNKSNHGVVSIYGGIPSANYEYFVSEMNHVLVSSFETQEFECSGTCACNEERRNAKILSGTLYVLVASLTTFGALTIAKRSFQKECEKSLKDYCPLDSIEARIKECLPPPAFVVVGESSNVKIDDGHRHVHCRGKCKAKEYLSEEYYEMSEKVDCDMTKVLNYRYYDHIYETAITSIHFAVKTYFGESVLLPFCENMSRRIVQYYTNDVDYEEREMTFCFADYDSINCIPIVDGKPMYWHEFYKHFDI